MNPDDTNTNPLDAAYAVRATADELVRLLREATPVNWDSTQFNDKAEL